MTTPTTPIVYTLKHPVNLTNAAGDVIECHGELRLHRLKGKDMRQLTAGGKAPSATDMVQASARISPIVADELDAEDIADAGKIVADFFGAGRPTGEI